MSDPKPPYVQFEIRAVEDRSASEESGHYVARDVTFAIVTPSGTRDRLEKVALDWIAGLEEGVKQERIPASWLDAYRDALKRFENNQEAPEFGTPLRDWAGVSPAQLRILQDSGCRSVEDVAEAHEELLGRIGMGSRALKERAQAWIDSANDVGKVAAELENLRVVKSELEGKIKTLTADTKTLSDQVKALQAKE